MPTVAELMREMPQFAALESKLVAQIGNADSTGEAFSLYEQHKPLLPDWKFVFASHRGARPQFAINRAFSDGSVVRSLFATECVLALDQETSREMLLLSDSTYPIDYSIGLDTQALSYLSPYIQGKKLNRIPADFREIFHFIARADVNVDPLPYCFENTPRMSNQKHADAVYGSLMAYHRLRTIDSAHLRETGEVRSKLSEHEIALAAQAHVSNLISDCKDPSRVGPLIYRHGLMLAVLLKAATIQIGSPQQSLGKKVTRLIEFMDEDLANIFQRELVVARRYFELGQEFAFFGKLQKNKNSDEMFRTLEGMAWDFLHIRHMEEMMALQGFGEKARYYFSAILTCDKRYVDVLDACPLKCIAFKPGEHRPHPYYVTRFVDVNEPEDFEVRLFERFYSADARSRRSGVTQLQLKNRLPGLLDNLRAEFLNAIGSTA